MNEWQDQKDKFVKGRSKCYWGKKGEKKFNQFCLLIMINGCARDPKIWKLKSQQEGHFLIYLPKYSGKF